MLYLWLIPILLIVALVLWGIFKRGTKGPPQ